MKKQQLLSLALGSAFAVAAISPAIAANPFEASKLDSGYQLAQADMKQKDGNMEGMTVMVVDGEEAVFVNVIGQLNPTELAQVMDKFDVHVELD